MRKILLSILAVGVYTCAFSQVSPDFKHMVAEKQQTLTIETPASTFSPWVKPVRAVPFKSSKAISIIPIGTSGNAYGLYNGGRTAIWADPRINSVVFVHRAAAVPGSGFLQYDLSKNGGATWTSNIDSLYKRPPDARYPQGGIYNPTGNTNPNNAYVAYFAPTLDNSNSNWGGYCYGVHKLDSSTSSKQGTFTSSGAIRQGVPDAFTITQGGVAWIVDAAQRDALPSGYTDTLIIAKGIWNSTTNTYDYTRSLLYFPTSKGTYAGANTSTSIADIKIAFAPNGQTGYISMLTHADSTKNKGYGYYPVFLKTTDGGANWSAPINPALTPIPAIQNFVSDDKLASYFTTVPPRENINYHCAFDHDLVVDANGNPHVVVVVSIETSTAWSVLTSGSGAVGYYALFEIFSNNGGTTWDAYLLKYLSRFRTTYTAGTSTISEDNRVQAASTLDGTKLFFTWLDTDTITFPGLTGNGAPDIWFAALDVTNDKRVPVINVTTGSTADGEANQGTLSHYVFGSTGSYSIPLVYQSFTSLDGALPVTYKYVHGFSVLDNQFKTPGEGFGDGENMINRVSQNYPNPFNDVTTIRVDLAKSTNLSVEVYNMIGQKVIELNEGSKAAGAHFINIKGDKLNSGIYFYTVTAGNQKVTKKMIVE